MTVVTLMRPALRRVPDPPIVAGTAPAWRLIERSRGTALGNADLRGQTWVAGVAATSCSGRCRATAEALGQLAQRFSAAGIPVRVLLFDLDPATAAPADEGAAGSAPHAVVVVGAEDADAACAPALALLAPCGLAARPACAGLHDLSHAGRVTLVDGQGRLRGCYTTRPVGLDEVFWRAQHALAEPAPTR
jgi:cytochrome oxidase Cu insertion factor (SCO1/SenC/PrrC family)